MTVWDSFPILSAMDDALLKFGLTAFATLLVVVDPFGVLPIFISLAKNRSPRERSGIATRAVLLGFTISLFFLVAGHSALAFLGVSVHAFSISGGILLFVTAVPMLFGQRPALQSAETNESGPEDIAIFRSRSRFLPVRVRLRAFYCLPPRHAAALQSSLQS